MTTHLSKLCRLKNPAFSAKMLANITTCQLWINTISKRKELEKQATTHQKDNFKYFSDMYLDLTLPSMHVYVWILWKLSFSRNFYTILHDSKANFTKYIQMLITSKRIIAQVSAKRPNEVFLMYCIEKLYFWLPNEFW